MQAPESTQSELTEASKEQHGGKVQEEQEQDPEIDALAEDPLFIILSEMFMSSSRGNSIADILENINDNLEKMNELLAKK